MAELICGIGGPLFREDPISHLSCQTLKVMEMTSQSVENRQLLEQGRKKIGSKNPRRSFLDGVS